MGDTLGFEVSGGTWNRGFTEIKELQVGPRNFYPGPGCTFYGSEKTVGLFWMKQCLSNFYKPSIYSLLMTMMTNEFGQQKQNSNKVIQQPGIICINLPFEVFLTLQMGYP